MQFLRSSLWAGVVIGSKALGSMLINKFISAYYQNPQVFALLAHFQNLLAIFSSIPSDGVNQGTIKYLSDKDCTAEKATAFFYTGLWLNGFLFMLSASLLFIFKEYITAIFLPDVSPAVWIFLILSVLLIQLLNLYLLSVFLAKRRLKLYALLNIASVAVGIALVIFALMNYSFPIVLVVAGFAPSSLFFVNAFVIHKYYFPLFKIRFPDKDSLKKLGQFILMAASIMLFDRVVDFGIRQYAMSAFSIYETGLWQSVVKFSDYYMAAFAGLMGMVYYPKVSELINDPEALRKYVRAILKMAIPIMAVGLLLCFFLRNHILLVFFDEKFLEAEKFFPFQLAGDFLKMISFMLGFVITAQARTKLFIGFQAWSATLYIGLVFVFSGEWGIEGFPVAHAVRYVVFSSYIVFLYRKLLF